ncbi:MAG: phosphatase PAP2 family protein [Acidobacteria bacterium]|nr:phosphatase PAP2 family protein [Acidobacteriota bacterium]
MARQPAVRASEYVIAAFFLFTSLLGAVLPLAFEMRLRLWCAALIVTLLYALLLRYSNRVWVDYLRDWVPQALMILAYRQMNWFAPETHTFQLEQQWIQLDRWFLDTLHVRAIVESFGVLLPSMLELSYSLVYAIPPLTMLLLYWHRQRDKADLVLTIYLLALFSCYAQFPFWPSEPPRTAFPLLDLPTVMTPFREFNLWLVGSYGIHTSVFPSAHVAGVLAAAMAMARVLPRARAITTAYFVYASLVALATVYGRYHYLADAIAGLVMGAVASPAGAWILRVVSSAHAPGRRPATAHSNAMPPRHHV